MNYTMDSGLAKDWAGLAIFERLSETGSALSSEEIGIMLGTRSVKGIGSALRQTRSTLSRAGIRFDETVIKRSVLGRTVWVGGPRIRQAVHVLEQERFRWTGKHQQTAVPIVGAHPGYSGPVLVLRALKSKEEVFRIDGGMPELDEVLEDAWFEIGEGRYEVIGEIFIDRIEPGTDGREYPIPAGYGENGIWVRGLHDYARPRVAGAIGTGRFPTMIACMGVATWVERRIILANAERQVETVRAAEGWLPSKDLNDRWNDVEKENSFSYVRYRSTLIISLISTGSNSRP